MLFDGGAAGGRPGLLFVVFARHIVFADGVVAAWMPGLVPLVPRCSPQRRSSALFLIAPNGRQIQKMPLSL